MDGQSRLLCSAGDGNVARLFEVKMQIFALQDDSSISKK